LTKNSQFLMLKISTSMLDSCWSPALSRQQQFWDEMYADYWMWGAIEGLPWHEQAALK